MDNFDKNWYNFLKKPSITPPSYVFGIVWPILYTLMGLSFYKIWVNKECYPYCSALTFFIIQIVFNLNWSRIFFLNKDIISALHTIIYMIIFTILTIYKFYKIDKKSAYLLMPYLIWITFALYINSYIYKNN